MVVFSQRDLPLTSNLRPVGVDSKEPEIQNKHGKSGENFDSILKTLIRSIRKGSPEGEFSWDYDYDSLWSPLLRGPKGKVDIWKCNRETYLGILRTRTYWYKRLPKPMKERVKRLASDSKGRRRIKDYLDTTDGVLMSLLFSFPEMFLTEGGYTASDRIINSVLCNCLQNYDLFQTELKKLRKRTRGCFLRNEESKLDERQLRMMSYMTLPLRLFNKNCHMTSKSWIFRLAMFCQTRATGLAGPKQVKESVDEFISMATTAVKFEPNELMNFCIDQVTTFLSKKIELGTNHSFRISMSTSACRESPRSKEGKFGHLKTLIRSRGIKIPPLLEGEGGSIGNVIWNEALDLRRKGDSSTMNVNVTAIRENGKSRIVTSGSFWKEAALQPFSHITIQLAKTLEQLRDGLSAGRLGWRFISQIEFNEEHDDGFNWIFDKKNRKNLRLFSKDWKRATDGPSPQMGREVVGSLLRKTGLDPEILDLVLDYWVGVKHLYYKGKYVGDLLRGIPMGDPLTKTNLSLAHPICDLYARIKTKANSKVNGNGDDVTGIHDKPSTYRWDEVTGETRIDSQGYADAYAEAAEILGYERSPDDDIDSQTWGTYCEEYFHLPVSRINTCKWGTRFKNSLLLPYLDVPKLRLMVATTKDRVDFSSDPRGKVTLMGHDEEYFDYHDPGPLKHIYAIAAGFQDVSLATIDYKYPLFLPRQVNGIGRAPSYWSTESWKNILRRCRPWHREYYLRVMYEYTRGVEGITSMRGSLKEDNHFAKEMMVELYTIPRDNPIRKWCLVDHDDWEIYPPGSLQKLVTTGYLVPESKIAKYYLFQIRLMSLEQEQPQVDLFECIKAKMISYAPIREDEEDSLIDNFVKRYRDSPYRLRTDRREPLYDSAVLKILDEGSPLAVTNSGYPLLQRFTTRPKPDTAYRRDAEVLYDWFRGVQWILKERGKTSLEPDDLIPPSNILEDDPLILQKVERLSPYYHCFVLVSNDQRLYRLLCNKLENVIIFRMPCSMYFQTRLWLKDSEKLDRTVGEGLTLEELDELDDDDPNGLGDELSEFAAYHKALKSVFKETYGEHCEMLTVFDRGNIESYYNQYNEDDSGILYQTIGIPWTSNIANKNMEVKPHHGRLRGISRRSWEDVRIPWSLGPETTHRHLQRLLRKRVAD